VRAGRGSRCAAPCPFLVCLRRCSIVQSRLHAVQQAAAMACRRRCCVHPPGFVRLTAAAMVGSAPLGCARAHGAGAEAGGQAERFTAVGKGCMQILAARLCPHAISIAPMRHHAHVYLLAQPCKLSGAPTPNCSSMCMRAPPLRSAALCCCGPQVTWHLEDILPKYIRRNNAFSGPRTIRCSWLFCNFDRVRLPVSHLRCMQAPRLYLTQNLERHACPAPAVVLGFSWCAVPLYCDLSRIKSIEKMYLRLYENQVDTVHDAQR
jgi:hypothetical protein